MKHFATLLDSNFLDRSFVLYDSLQRHSPGSVLWVAATDRKAYDLLQEAELKNLRVFDLENLASEQTLALRQTRTKAEFHWTLTPQIFEWVFQMDSKVNTVTYLDADVWFMNSPDKLLDDFQQSDASVLITEHGYAPAFDQSKRSGRFCVQFLAAKRDLSADIISRWKRQCLEWCFDRHEEGKFGDQKYLDEWPEIWAGRVFIPSVQSFQGPWNAIGNKPETAVLFHFHGLSLIGTKRYSIGSYPVGVSYLKLVYEPYVLALREAQEKYSLAPPSFELASAFLLFLKRLRRMERRAENWLTHLLSSARAR